MSAGDTSSTSAEDRRGVAFWAALAAGGALMAYGVVGLLGASAATQPRNLATFLLGAGVVHDAVLAPLVVIVGWLVTRLLPPFARVPVWFALAATGLLVAFTWPLVQGWGRRSANPSLLPYDYGRIVAIGVALIWIVALAVVAGRLLARRRSG